MVTVFHSTGIPSHLKIPIPSKKKKEQKKKKKEKKKQIDYFIFFLSK